MKKLLYAVSFAALYALATTNTQAQTYAAVPEQAQISTLQAMPIQSGEEAVAGSAAMPTIKSMVSAIQAQALEDDSDEEAAVAPEMDDSNDSDDSEVSDMAATKDNSDSESSDDGSEAEAPAVDTTSMVSVDELVTQGQTVAQIKNVLAKALQGLVDELLGSSSATDEAEEAPEVEAPTVLQSIDLTDLSSEDDSDSDDDSEDDA